MNIAYRTLLALALTVVAACGGANATDLPEYPPFEPDESLGDETSGEEPTREPPPESGPASDIRFPAMVHRTVANGLSLDVIESHVLPVAHFTLLFRSGSDSDPENLPGLASFVADMLKEGTRTKSSEQLAAAFDAIGARYSVEAGQESITISVSVLVDELPTALSLVAEMITQPKFDPAELDKLKRRERDRLSLELQDPNFLARRTIRRELYGNHPYARIDTTIEAIERVTQAGLRAFHRAHIVPANAALIVAGDIDAGAFATTATRAFRSFRGGAAPVTSFPTPPARTGRTILVVDRPGSVQSVIRVGNLAIPRNSPDFIPLLVANHILGGGANSRLFVDLREQRGLTYGAYSAVVELTDVAPFAVATSVRTAVTVEAIGGIFEHLDKIASEAAPPEELAFAERYLGDSFPLQIDTPSKMISLVVQQRVFGLPDGYWDTYRTSIAAVTSEQALEAARRHIRPSEAVVVVVGESSAFAEALARFGSVRVVDADGGTIRSFDAAPSN